MLPFVLLFKTFGFTEFGVGLLERNVQWITRLLTLFLCLLSLDLELAVMPVTHSLLTYFAATLHSSAMFLQSLQELACCDIQSVCKGAGSQS